MKLPFDTRGNEKQKACAVAWGLNDSVTEIIYGGSKGSAKSYTGCNLIFGDALTYDGTFYFIARKKLNDLRKYTIPSIYEVFEHWGIKVEDYMTFNGQDSVFELHNGSKVFLIDAKYLPSDPQYARFGSIQMTRGWIEEGGEFETDSKSNLAASIGRWKNKEYGLTGKLLITCNPSKNFLYQDYKANKEGSIPDYKRFIQALPTDNKCLPDGYLEHLDRTLTDSQKQRLLYGNWEYDDDPTSLIEYENIVRAFEGNGQTGLKYISCDYARYGSDTTVIGVWNGYRVKLYQYKGLSTVAAAEEIKRLQRVHGIASNSVVVDEDGVGGGVVDILRCKGFVNNSRAIDENFDNLKSQCYFKLADAINEGKVFIDGGDYKDKIIQELEQVKQKSVDATQKKGIVSKDVMKEQLGRSPDFSDCLAMRFYFDVGVPKGVVRAKGFT